MKKINKNNTYSGLLFLGTALIGLGLGSIYTLFIRSIQQIIFIITFLVVIYYINESLSAHYKKKTLRIDVIVAGYLATFLFALFFSLQNTFGSTFGMAFLVIGILLVGYWTYDFYIIKKG